MKFKRITVIAALVSIVSLGSVLAYNYNNSSQEQEPVIKQNYYGKGKRMGFENIAEMEDKSTLIVIGKKLDKEVPTILLDGVEQEDGYEGVLGGYTISDFQVKKILKNTSGKEVEKNQVIPVLENAATDVIGDGKKKVTYTNDGYELMKKGKHYILFMDESGSGPGTFIPLSAIYGKAPLEAKKGDLEFNGEDKFVKKIINEATKKYKKEVGTIKE
ncbi:hypothetical protein ELQ35_04525 [Peribacillus cavernae]|uniref:Lipoprotein n=1 Tax=Peribacillus cavernae TaxID=1674310 RepID=A0A3S0W336_9BACI|nr:hypothetical protein [Peribacillus cavernae]MDQ0218633.1 hypothetical protein [Peribacillus cavernae]RUQ31613.1 hypothetical protein ELQ35_04525 [Peribacillus cavernae]